MHLLLVDDDTDSADILCAILEQHGFDVDWCCDGAAALAHLRTHNCPDMILLDIDMPEMDGYEFRAAQMSVPEWATIPVVIMSGNRVDESRTFDAPVLSKPLRATSLLAALRASARVIAPAT